MQAVVYVGDKVKRLRDERALTQGELADKAGLTVAALSRIERNNAEPRPTTRRKLAEALGVDPSELIGG
ncbi:MAG TPA: helix-turn-helix transcriptional regulator [Rubrobacter sp.]|jgi:transcriptional regulator with XRE-family HTH domain|nr:helix-turn-helix transcriptional regulator [Rubrobacter sp.]